MNSIRKKKWNTHQQAAKEKTHGVARVISKRGFCSRSQAENLVLEGRVSLRGKIVHDPDAPARENDEICVDGKIVKASEFVYFMMNKPRGYVTTASDEKGRATVMDLFREQYAKMSPTSLCRTYRPWAGSMPPAKDYCCLRTTRNGRTRCRTSGADKLAWT